MPGRKGKSSTRDAPGLTRPPLSDDYEVGCCDGVVVGKNRQELLRPEPGAVLVEIELPGRLVVDEPVVGIDRPGAKDELVGW